MNILLKAKQSVLNPLKISQQQKTHSRKHICKIQLDSNSLTQAATLLQLAELSLLKAHQTPYRSSPNL